MGIPQQQEPQQEKKNPAVQLAKNAAKKQVKKAGKKLAKKAAKKAVVLAKKALAIALKALAKMILGLLATVGVPTILITIGIVIAVIIIFLSISFFFGTGTELEGEDQKLYDYMVEQLDKTIDLSRPEQKQYRVPEELLAAVIQSDIVTEEYEGREKELIRKMATSLKPTFEYEDYNDYREAYTETCEDGVCESTPVKKTDQWLKKITYVNGWNGSSSYEYEANLSEWAADYDRTIEIRTREVQVPGVDNDGNEILINTTEEYEVVIETYHYTRKMRNEVVNSQTTSDFATFDSILNQYGFGKNDKKLVEAMYEFSTEKPLGYIAWLEGFGGIGFSGGGFMGTVVPGGNVPAQFMEYYRKAEKKYGIPWNYLAALHFVETSFSDSQDPSNVSSVGAIGPFQFMPLSWLGWAASDDYGGSRLGDATIPIEVLTDPSKIRKYGGYGQDGDDDGKSDPWSVADGSMTAAYYLAANGFKEDKRKAIFAYNHAEWYVDKIIKYADQFHLAATYSPTEGMPPMTKGEVMAPATGRITTNFGWDVLNGARRYHYGMDIAKRGQVPIVAFADGKVRKSYFSTSYGNVVILTHNIGGTKVESLYAHMQNRNVTAGQEVKKGTFLGYMGTTGKSTGQHLHFELHNGAWNSSKSNAFDPQTMIRVSN